MSADPGWEYKSVAIETKSFWSRGIIDVTELDERMNELGAGGWELVSVVSVGDGTVGTARLLFTFKRPTRSTVR